MSKTTPHQSQESGKPGNTGLKRIVKATGYSIQGLKAAFKHEAAIRQELALLSIAVILAWLVDVGMVERILMIGGRGISLDCRACKLSD